MVDITACNLSQSAPAITRNDVTMSRKIQGQVDGDTDNVTGLMYGKKEISFLPPLISDELLA